MIPRFYVAKFRCENANEKKIVTKCCSLKALNLAFMYKMIMNHNINKNLCFECVECIFFKDNFLQELAINEFIKKKKKLR